MKKFFLPLAALSLFLAGCVMTSRQPEKSAEPVELRGVWFSFYDWDTLPGEADAFRAAVDEVTKTVSDLGLNTIFLHVHSHSDSYYLKSSYFPYSKRAPSPAPAESAEEKFDPLSIFIESAHKRGLELHAWFNPYRIGSPAQLESAPADSCIGTWRTAYESSLLASGPDAEPETAADSSVIELVTPDGELVTVREVDSDGNILQNESAEQIHIPCPIINHNGVFYLNPASAEIQQTLVAAIREVCQNYEIDGIHFDDYFYPVLNDNESALSFDKIDWEKSGSEKSLVQWRRDNVSSLIEAVHKTAAEYNLVFGISPVGNFQNLTAKNHYLIDIDLWLSTDRYIDYIMPQIYWGFEPRAPNGNLRPWAFENCLQTWKDHLANSPVTLYVGLALYKAGIDSPDGNEVSEWLRYNDIISRQILVTRSDPTARGFVLYGYKDLLTPERSEEVSHIREVLN